MAACGFHRVVCFIFSVLKQTLSYFVKAVICTLRLWQYSDGIVTAAENAGVSIAKAEMNVFVTMATHSDRKRSYQEYHIDAMINIPA